MQVDHLIFWKAGMSGVWRTEMTRRIFYARRSKRPIFITLGLMGLCVTVFYVGFQAGRTHPDLFALQNAKPVVIAER